MFACHFTGDGGNTTYSRNDKNMMAGVHAICGFSDDAIYYEESFQQAETWAQMMRGTWPFAARSIISAWNDGNDLYQPSGTRLKTWYGTYCWSDRLPGVGSYYASDPIPYESGGNANSHVYTCS